MWNWMSSNQKGLFFLLLFTTFFGAFLYAGYLGITYRLELTDPIKGPEIRARETAIASVTAEKTAAAQAKMRENLKFLAVALPVIVVFGLVADRIEHSNKAKASYPPAAQATPAHAADGCDLAGAIPNCSEVVGKFTKH